MTDRSGWGHHPSDHKQISIAKKCQNRRVKALPTWQYRQPLVQNKCFITVFFFPPQDIMRSWVKDHPVSAKRLTEGSVAQAILSQEPSTEVSFTAHPDANPASRQKVRVTLLTILSLSNGLLRLKFDSSCMRWTYTDGIICNE